MQISRLTLLAQDAGVRDIEIQMNPVELKQVNETKTQQNPGANNAETGTPKVSFAEIQARTIAFTTTYDNYESGDDVVAQYIAPYEEATKFIKVGNIRRPPVYQLRWGEKLYFRRCFVEKFDYKVTMIGSNGRPLRADVNVLLKEVEDPNASSQANDSFDVNQATRNQGSPNVASLFSSVSNFLNIWN